MTQTPTHPPTGPDHTGAADTADTAAGGTGTDSNVTSLGNAGGDAEHPATRAARARRTNAHRATYAAEALHRHGQVSHSDADDMQQALVELLTDLHHLCDTCDLDLTPLYEAATLIHTRETQAA
jgi:hypothetical protein